MPDGAVKCQIVAVLRQIAGEILRTILRLSEVITHSEAPVTNPIAANEVRLIEVITHSEAPVTNPIAADEVRLLK